MKFFTSISITLALATLLFAQSPTPKRSVTEEQAWQELNEAARAYREGKFAEAQAHSERALLLDPQNKTAPMFVARTIHAQYKPGDLTPENVARAQQAIFAYQRILDRTPSDDEAYKAVAYLYGAIKEDEQLRAWIMQRAGNVSVANDKRAEAFVVLASKDWDCSFKITEQPGTKVTKVKGEKVSVTYHMPKDGGEFEKAGECANHGIEMANMAIVLTPENEVAWSYKTNLLLELAKLAEMSGDIPRKRKLLQEYKDALAQTTKFAQQRSESKP